MNNTSEKRKDSILKTLAIIGFTTVVVIIAWLSITLVHLVPSAFSSLASLAESMYQRGSTSENQDTPRTLTVTSNTTIANTGETVELTWANFSTPGSYTFSYACAEGVAVDIINFEGLRSIACDTNYNVGDTSSLLLSIDSEKKRYTDVRYTVSFFATNDTLPRAQGSASLTIVNSAIQDTLVESTETETDTNEDTPDTEGEDTTTLAEEETVNTTTPTNVQEFVYRIPTSDPGGHVDLGTRFLNTGKIIGQTFLASPLSYNEDGAIQFEVKNYGTKTSSEWTFTVQLPDRTYTSEKQNPLKPNERSVLTIGFPATTDTQHTFSGTIDEPADNTAINDNFRHSVTFVR